MLINLSMKNNMLIKMMKSSLLDLPTPSFINYMWNWGFMLGMMLMIQIITGIFLASHYDSNFTMAFYSIISIMRDVPMGYFFRYIHMNGASLFFMIIYIHIFRNLVYSSFKNKMTWMTGIILLLLLMGTAFMGYVLPWGQMSYWGATVITNLASAIPIWGNSIVQWIWGGFSIGKSTLSRFFMLHFLMPFILTIFVVLHIFFLHEKGSSNPMGISMQIDKIPFMKYFMVKDLLTLVFILNFFLLMSLMFPFYLGDPENFNVANPLVTPIHIMPEWYFLFAYAILRSIPSKLGGVIALLMSILIFIFHVNFKKNNKTFKFKPLSKFVLFMFLNIFIILTWLGSCVVESPYEEMSKLISVFYFLNVFLI